MHWVDRGPEPEGLAQIRRRYTSRWIQHYAHGVGSKPTDSHWRRFTSDLKCAFNPHFPYQPCRASRNQQQNYLM